MSKVKIETWPGNRDFIDLYNDPAIMEVMKQAAEEVRARAGDGYEVQVVTSGKARNSVRVYADTKEAKKDNLENNTLLKAIGK